MIAPTTRDHSVVLIPPCTLHHNTIQTTPAIQERETHRERERLEVKENRGFSSCPRPTQQQLCSSTSAERERFHAEIVQQAREINP